MGKNVVCQTTGLSLPLRNRINWMMENSFDIVVIIDLKTNLYKYASPSHSRILGLSVQDLLGTCWLDYIHPDDIDYVADQVRLGLTAGNNSAVYRHLNKQGDYVWLHTIGSIITETEYNGDLLLVSRNIQQLKYIEEQLQESEEKYRLITDNAQDLILLLDPISLTCTFASPSISRFLGYQEKEILGTSFFQHIHPLDLENVIISTRRFTFKSQDNIMQYRLVRKDGSYLWAESVGKMFRSKEDKWNLLLSTRDISISIRGLLIPLAMGYILHPLRYKGLFAFPIGFTQLFFQHLSHGIAGDSRGEVYGFRGFKASQVLTAVSYYIFFTKRIALL